MIAFMFGFIVLVVFCVIAARIAVALVPLVIIIGVAIMVAEGVEQIGGLGVLIPTVISVVVLGLLLLKSSGPKMISDVPLRGSCPHYPQGFPSWVVYCPPCGRPVEHAKK
jgi:hypothetical protein